MDIHGNFESTDVFGNTARNVFGEATDANVFGNSPMDVLGNPGLESGHDLLDGMAEGGVVGGIVNFLWSLIG